MRSRSLSLLTGLAVLLLPACSGSGTANAGTGTAADEQAIRDLAPKYATAFGKHDAKAMAAMSTEDYEDVDPMGVHTQGRAGIEQNMGKQFAMMPANMAMTTTTAFVKFLSPTTAVAGGTWQTTPAVPGQPDKGSWMAVAVKKDSTWLMASSLGAAAMPAMAMPEMATPDTTKPKGKAK
jgi:uncharacterized protein (TIGR02246 family)